ncbi:TetR family transcriptional regulator [Marmoricola endophyticus]|uniref:TetR family transcriptional regulator n=1 Tax=Marmoricola endophyticus TaxID=2040280 RepID=A0A917BHE3_9ACTN|nr:TetR family transcriptional regulator [Marmoricola endophyticus]GGF39943.1 TetR family transcriptional regulator [Marmoricola endophyticus]
MVAQRDAERTRAELLDVATQVFAEDGFSGARVDVIAERTRTTKRMIYYYFASKEGLYLAVLERAYLGIRAAEQELHVGDLSPVDGVRRLAELTFDHHQAHPEFIRLVSIENIHGGRFIARLDSLREMGNPAASLLEDVLSRGRSEGTFRADVDAVDVHMVISAYCVFPVANQHTFGYLFDRDLRDPSRREHLRRTIGDLVVAWLTA